MKASLHFAPELLLLAQGTGLGLKAAIFDVDGVLTDGSIYIGEQGESFKAFSSLDGHGLKLLVQGGITPIIITGRDSPAVRRRVADLGLQWAEVAVMGDDWPDLPLLTRAGFACAPAQAHAEVKAVAHYVTQAEGGRGAARECCDLLLQANGRYAQLLNGHLDTLDGGA